MLFKQLHAEDIYQGGEAFRDGYHNGPACTIGWLARGCDKHSNLSYRYNYTGVFTQYVKIKYPEEKIDELTIADWSDYHKDPAKVAEILNEFFKSIPEK